MAVQLTGDEVTCVWTNMRTGRIMGFAPINCTFPGMWNCMCIPLHHANEISAWADRYRAQQKADFEERQYAQLTKDDAVRKRIREALRARRNVVGPLQRADIDRGLRFLDTIEQRMKPQAPEGALLIERCEATKRKEDIALESPAFKPQPVLPRKLLTAGS
jgi:hypothetical protein